MKNQFKNLLSIAAVGLFMVMAIATSEKKETADQTSTAEEKPKEPEKKENWTYSEEEDKMSGAKKYYAICNASNSFEFKFPYNGGSVGSIFIRNTGKGSGNEVIIMISKGRIRSSFAGSESMRIKFDEQAPENYSYTSPREIESTGVFIDNPKKFIQKLKAAKKVMIEASFYNEGTQIMEFSTEGFTWDK